MHFGGVCTGCRGPPDCEEVCSTVIRRCLRTRTDADDSPRLDFVKNHSFPVRSSRRFGRRARIYFGLSLLFAAYFVQLGLYPYLQHDRVTVVLWPVGSTCGRLLIMCFGPYGQFQLVIGCTFYHVFHFFMSRDQKSTFVCSLRV